MWGFFKRDPHTLYQIYKRKGLIDNDFNEITIDEFKYRVNNFVNVILASLINDKKGDFTQLNDIIAIFNKMRGSITGTVEESKKFRLMHRSLIELGKVAEKLNREIEVLTKKNKLTAASN